MSKWIVLIAVLIAPVLAQLPPIPGGNQPPPPGEQEVDRSVDHTGWYVIAAEILGTTAGELEASESSILEEAQMAGISPVWPLLFIFISEYRGMRDLHTSGQLTLEEMTTLQRSVFFDMVKFVVFSPDAVANASTADLQARWAELGLENYTLSTLVSCECIGIPSLQAIVGGGVLQSVDVEILDWVDLGNGQSELQVVESAPGDLETYGWLTAEGIVARSLFAIDNDAEYVRIEYHPVYGYISDLYVDFSSFVADEELSYQISIVPVVSE